MAGPLDTGIIPVDILAGHVKKYIAVHNQYKANFIFHFMTLLNESFWSRAKTQYDSDGNHWESLAQKTIRIKQNAIKKGKSTFHEGKVGNARYVGTLSPAMRLRWERSYNLHRRKLSDAKAKEKAWESIGRASSGEASIAELINIRTGNLVRSTSPGRVSSNRYYPPPNQKVTYRGISDASIELTIDYAENVDQLRPIIPDDVQRWKEYAHHKALKVAEDLYKQIKRKELTPAEYRRFLRDSRSNLPF